MRPIDRGAWPVQSDGLPIQFKKYSDARKYLLERLHGVCSYCEMPITNQPAVEHVQPKVHHEDIKRTWCNLLLACCYCNASKGRQDAGRAEYLWPDADNTARAFLYSEAGIHVNKGLSAELFERASRTWKLIGLDKRPGGEREPSAADRRFRLRQEAWGQASHARQVLRENRTPDVIKLIIDFAKSTGFWSVWMAVFEDDIEMRLHFIRAFEGTAALCFDSETRPVQRIGGML